MRLKKFLIISGALIFSVAVFIINTVTKNVDLGDTMIFYVRSALVILTFLLIYLFIYITKRERQRSIIQNIGNVALFAGIFLATYLVISLLPLKGFDSREFRLFPRDYLTIFFSSIISIVAGIFSIITILLIRDLVLYKRKKHTSRNYWILIGCMAIASLSTISLRPLEDSVVSGIFSGVSIVMIILNSFRLGWIAYLPRKEKVYSLLYSLLSFFGFLAILIILSIQDGWTQKGIHYFSSPLFTFVQLSATFGAVYFGMAFSSTLFHLPTAEAFDRKQTEISSLHNLSRLINQVFDVKDLAETATKMVTEVVQASCVWLEIIPVSGSGNKNRLLSVRNINEADLQFFISDQEKSIRSVVFQTKKVLMVDDISDDKRTKQIPKIRNIGSLLMIPLLSHNNVIGILSAAKDINYGFEQDDIDILSGFADQVAIAIENARLIERSFEKERLQRELMLAQEMQKRLLPQQLPQFSNVEMKAISSPALEVGGDYYDVVQVEKNKVGIVVGDVSGKGVGAAFYMAEVKGIFQSLARIYHSPKEFLIRANESLLTSIDRKSFISLIYTTINIETGELVMARAGHCPMLYITEKKKEYIRPLGLGLGLKAGKVFEDAIEEKKIIMRRGDICVFYTDGVTESRSSRGEEFGYDRLLEIVDKNKKRSAEEIKESIIQSVWNYTDEKGYHDDLTVYVIKWLGN